MWTLELLFTIATHAVAVGVGAWGYRWMLRRDPAKLERWAAELGAAGDKIKAKLGNS